MQFDRGKLYIVATPIGNLEDITYRAVRVLQEVDLILAEDTRISKKLLMRYDIKKPIRRYDEHVAPRLHDNVVGLLLEGTSIALMSDAGTPNISDPGARLVAYVRAHVPLADIIPIPGASAITTALSVSGFSGDRFTFLGYPPHKKGRKTFFETLPIQNHRPIILYESPHRVERTLTEIAENFGSGHKIVVARELTKIYENIFSGTIGEAQTYITGEKKKGEFVIIIS
jgi:16S rRNA (cytidine1402-2'-O)-methyltransferase